MKYFTHILLAAALILFGGCKSAKQVTSSTVVVKDSISYVETVRVDTLRITEDRSSASFHPDSIPVRYVGVVAYRDTGRSTVVVYRNADGSYTALSRCDSIYRLLVAKDSELRNASSKTKTEYRDRVVVQWPSWLRFAVAALVLIILLYIISIPRHFFI